MMKYPIRVNLDLPAHKVSLLIQAALGGIEIESNSRYSTHQRQFRQDTSLVFQHAKRLIRCIIDCKVKSKDAIAVRNALELARSLGAYAWDDSPHQLSQLENIGSVAVRKLVSFDIRSMEDLEFVEPHRIDMALSRNPPFGAMLLKKLKTFPKLRLSLRMASNPSLRQHGGVEVKVQAELGFLNDQPPVYWRKAPVQVYCLAETSDGRLVHFARTNSKSIGEGQAVNFTAELFEPQQMISCYVACDNIAGTLKHATLDPKVPSTMFQHSAKAAVPSSGALKPRYTYVPDSSTVRDEYDDYLLDDNDLADAALQSKAHTTQSKGCHNIDDFFSDSSSGDELMSQNALSGLGVQRKPLSELNGIMTSKKPFSVKKACDSKIHHRFHPQKSQPKKFRPSTESDWRPERLPSGKWKCSHTCKDKQKCGHQCCKTGMHNPPRAPPKAQATEDGYEQSSIWKNFMERNQASSKEYKVIDSKTADHRHRKLRGTSSSHINSGGSNTRVPTSSTAYGDDPFADDLDELVTLPEQLTSHGGLKVPYTACVSPRKDGALFLNDTSSPSKADVEVREDALDDMPLAKRRRTSTGRIATLSDLEAGAYKASFEEISQDQYIASSPPRARDGGDDGEESFVDNQYLERNWSLRFLEDEDEDEDGVGEQTSRVNPEVGEVIPQQHDGYTARTSTGPEGILDSDGLLRDRPGHQTEDPTASGAKAQGFSNQRRTFGASEQTLEEGRAASKASDKTPDSTVPQEDNKGDQEEDATAWMLREFGKYVDVVD